MFELRQPKYQWGQKVAAALDLLNDGSHPGGSAGALLVAQGAVGEIVQVGHHVEASEPVYLVEFPGPVVVGCLEPEIAPA